MQAPFILATLLGRFEVELDASMGGFRVNPSMHAGAGHLGDAAGAVRGGAGREHGRLGGLGSGLTLACMQAPVILATLLGRFAVELDASMGGVGGHAGAPVQFVHRLH